MRSYAHGRLSLPFFPSRHVPLTPKSVALDFQNLRLKTDDGEHIHCWFVPRPPSTDEAPLTILFLHGNGGSLSSCLDTIAICHQLGCSVLSADYRGFGTSSGRPSVLGAITDAHAAHNWLTKEYGCSPNHIVYFGRSLGGGVAAALASQKAPAGLILESTFTSIRAVARHLYPLLPTRWLFPQDFDTPARLDALHCPLLVMHSPHDRLVPYSMGCFLYERYQGPKHFAQLQGSHGRGYLLDIPKYMMELSTFLRTLRPEQQN